MRTTILPKAVILTKACRRGQYGSQGVYCSLSTASEVFLIFTTQLYSCLCKYVCNGFHFMTRGKYCNRNTPNP